MAGEFSFLAVHWSFQKAYLDVDRDKEGEGRTKKQGKTQDKEKHKARQKFHNKEATQGMREEEKG